MSAADFSVSAAAGRPKYFSTINYLSEYARTTMRLATFRRKIGVFGIVADDAQNNDPPGLAGRVLKCLSDSEG